LDSQELSENDQCTVAGAEIEASGG
jgi:hypothetical protein